MTNLEFKEIEEYTKDLVNTYFPKLNQDNFSKPSPNHRGEAIALVAQFLVRLSEMIKD